MKIEYKCGNMFENYNEPEIFLAHGCNAQGVMGSGVAKELRDRYPWAYSMYRREYENNGLQLGQVHAVMGKDSDNRMVHVFNCITQNQYGRDGRRYANYGAIQECMSRIDQFAYKRQRLDSSNIMVRMSMIGSSLGGADWSVIAQIIERESTYFQPVVYDLTP